jgi:DNA-binding NarL/FixJ family response regulator
MIDRDIHLARALLVENNPLLRSVAAAQLRDVGVGHISQATRVNDARLMLEREPFDIVVCNREFEESDYSGQDLLDELRRENLLPHSTVFIMVTSQASYSQVVEAGEAALDGFLVRPYTAALLSDRIREARKRKRELHEVLRALDAGETEVALVHAVKRFQEQQPYWGYCGRLAAELLLTLGRPDDARKVFDRLSQTRKGVQWARLGAARCCMAQGDDASAQKIIIEVLAEEPASADARDLLGRILVDRCDFEGALDEYRKAAELTPGCMLRAQHAGALAFYQGHNDESMTWLERTLNMGVRSKLFDALSLLLIAMLRFDKGDVPGTLAMREQLRRYCERFPGSIRLRRFQLASDVLAKLLGLQQAAALSALEQLAADALEGDFDLEAANVLLALWSRVPVTARPAATHEALIERIGMRFCVSKSMAEVLTAAAQRAEPAVSLIRRCQSRVSAVTERAMELSLKGQPGEAARLLLASGESSLNAKLLEMSAALARRHQATIPDAEALIERSAAVMRNCKTSTNHIAGIQRSGRSPGGLQVRGRKPSPSAPDQIAA